MRFTEWLSLLFLAGSGVGLVVMAWRWWADWRRRFPTRTAWLEHRRERRWRRHDLPDVTFYDGPAVIDRRGARGR